MSEDESKIMPDSPAARALAWLADAPMFIDGEQVTALYNAVAKPEHETEKITLSMEKLGAFEGKGKVGVEGKVGLAKWIKTIFPFLDAEAKVSVEGEVSGKREKKEGSEIELRPIETPQRQLVQLALHYFVNLPFRTRVVEKITDDGWLEDAFVGGLPRGLVFVEFSEETPFVPMAVEVDQGTVQVVYKDLMDSLVGPKQRKDIPVYPEPAYYKGRLEELMQEREKYWNFFASNFSSTLAMEAIEQKAARGGLIHWIAYRVPLGAGLPFLHLNISGHGRYDTGTFAYGLVKRGYKHGLRVVGTMKSEPAMNVLAIFER